MLYTFTATRTPKDGGVDQAAFEVEAESILDAINKGQEVLKSLKWDSYSCGAQPKSWYDKHREDQLAQMTKDAIKGTEVPDELGFGTPVKTGLMRGLEYWIKNPEELHSLPPMSDRYSQEALDLFLNKDNPDNA